MTRQRNALGQFVSGVELGAAKRVLGGAELGLNTTKALAELLGVDSSKLQSMKEAIAGVRREGESESKDNGIAGFVGELLGDPVNYIPGIGGVKAATKAGKALQIAGKGALAGGLSGLSQGTGKDTSDLGDNAINTAIGAALGGTVGLAVPAVAGATKGVSNAVRGTINRTGAALGSQKAADKVALDILGKSLAKDGFKPDEIKIMLDRAQKAGLGSTLGEATQSPSALQNEKLILKGRGESARTMRDALQTRNETTIPNAIKAQIAPLEKEADKASGFYKDAYTEGDNIINGIDSAISGGSADLPLSQAQKITHVTDALNNISASIEERLARLGDVGGPEAEALKHAKTVIENAKKLGDTEALHAAKLQLDTPNIKSGDLTDKKIAKSALMDYRKQLDNALSGLAYDNYPKAKAAAMQGMAARDVNDALSEARSGSIAQLYTKIWKNPELREDFLRKLPDDVTRQQFTDVFSQLENVSKGFGGSDTAFNQAGGKSLQNDILGVDLEGLNPLHSLQSAGRWVGDKFYPEVSKAIAKQSLNPDAEALGGSIMRQGATVLDNNAVKGVAETAALPMVKGLESPQAPVETAPYNPDNDPELQKLLGAPQEQAPYDPDQDPELQKLLAPEQHGQADAPNVMDRIAQAESGGDPNAKNPNSSASGTYQFTDPTWKAMVGKYGQKTGITEADKSKPDAQKIMAGLLADENGSYLKNKGFEASPENVYLAHFLGAGGAGKVLGNPDAIAASLLPKAAKANQNVFYKGGSALSGRQLQAEIARRLMNA